MDIYGRRSLFALLAELAVIDGIHWIRLHYAYPAGFPDDVIELMKNEPKITPPGRAARGRRMAKATKIPAMRRRALARPSARTV